VSLRKGEILNNRYRIVKQLGEGGFGAVYRAVDTVLKTDVAVKENLEYWDVAQRQFEREAVLLANLRHTNLPRVIDFFIMPAQGQYLVMDFVEGYDLQTVIDRIRKPLNAKPVLLWIDQICDALAFLHNQTPPIIHRDIKPANIRITSSGQAVLVDFGIAKAFDPEVKTTTGARAFTPGFSPIEQYGEETTDVHADQYAVGATLYALLTGKRPLESIARVTGKFLIKPRELNPEISPTVENVILRAMEVQAKDRYHSITAFRNALQKAAESTKKSSTHNHDVTPFHTSSQSEYHPSKQHTPTKETPQPEKKEASAPYTSTSVRLTKAQKTASSRLDAQPEWISIPAGDFLFGEDPKVICLPEFEISKFPITNQQYQAFLAANIYHPAPAHWKERIAPVSKLRHPVVGINLHDAVAFCRWLGCRLPTQEEWEKAARGENARTFPWGEEWEAGKYCNTWDAHVGGTTPVDRYMIGASCYGVWDMAGNVWEWTSSEHRGPYMHILRGGSWRAFGSFAVRAIQTDTLTVDDWRDDVGFRCTRTI